MQLDFPSSWKDFENLCYELFKAEWPDKILSKYGREGSSQKGVDFYACDQKKNQIFGVQCKKYEGRGNKLKIKDIINEIEKARDFQPPLEHYILATTSKRNVALQDDFNKFIQENELPFGVDIWFWDDIELKLNSNPALKDRFYPPKYKEVSILADNAKIRNKPCLEIYEARELYYFNYNSNLRGYFSTKRICLEFGHYDDCFTGKFIGKIEGQTIPYNTIFKLIEDFFNPDIPETFSIRLNMEDKSAEICVNTDHQVLCTLVYVEGDEVFFEEAIPSTPEEKEVFRELLVTFENFHNELLNSPSVKI